MPLALISVPLLEVIVWLVDRLEVDGFQDVVLVDLVSVVVVEVRLEVERKLKFDELLHDRVGTSAP